MLWISCIGVWFALCVSFAVSAGIIGMPAASITYEIVRGTLLFIVLTGGAVGARRAVREWRRRDEPFEPLRDA